MPSTSSAFQEGNKKQKKTPQQICANERFFSKQIFAVFFFPPPIQAKLIDIYTGDRYSIVIAAKVWSLAIFLASQKSPQRHIVQFEIVQVLRRKLTW